MAPATRTPLLPLAVPVQVARGHAVEEYPFDWSVYEWLPGENANGTIAFQADMALPYYRHTNPDLVRQASHALTQVLADDAG